SNRVSWASRGSLKEISARFPRKSGTQSSNDRLSRLRGNARKIRVESDGCGPGCAKPLALHRACRRGIILLSQLEERAMHDIVIRGGTMIDGAGKAAFTGELAIAGERLVEVGGKLGPARREIDASGLLVTPGWVDVHTHYDGQAMWDPLLGP